MLQKGPRLRCPENPHPSYGKTRPKRDTIGGSKKLFLAPLPKAWKAKSRILIQGSRSESGKTPFNFSRDYNEQVQGTIRWSLTSRANRPSELILVEFFPRWCIMWDVSGLSRCALQWRKQNPTTRRSLDMLGLVSLDIRIPPEYLPDRKLKSTTCWNPQKFLEHFTKIHESFLVNDNWILFTTLNPSWYITIEKSWNIHESYQKNCWRFRCYCWCFITLANQLLYIHEWNMHYII